MSHDYRKFEDPMRLSELNPKQTLLRIGLGKEDFFCDIGAGSGVFTLPAAEITKNTVFALDINEEFLKIIGQKAERKGLSHITTAQVTEDRYEIDTGQADLVLLVTVLHEIKNKQSVLSEIKRVLKDGGK